MRLRFDDAKKPCCAKLLPLLESEHGVASVDPRLPMQPWMADALLRLVCDVLFGEGGADPEPALVQAATRLEPLLGGASVGPAHGRRWAAVSRRILKALPRDQRSDWLGHAEGQLAGRGAPDDETVRAALDMLFEAHGRLPLASLARRLGVPVLRGRDVVGGLQRLLNVDGYAVLRFDSAAERVELDGDLLIAQFGLEA